MDNLPYHRWIHPIWGYHLGLAFQCWVEICTESPVIFRVRHLLDCASPMTPASLFS
ncbi:hypothetical protein BDV30DRAFT_206426 [Aspergillus minisclerotigenes]|uniref:Uncharacterized protein n=1 Tax=Aspergillus minisclerotigenes TaxID=656917 RepID=A0A5N6JEB4_9EURO|nr:hypothetical protein BDV30DRAFT_206426 [Aspergillus minisclerotigenes]